MSDNARTPAQVYCLVFGAVLVLAGIVGFFTNSSFDTGDDAPRGALIGLFDVNGWHNVVHVLSGGRIVKSGDRALALELEDKGYGWLEPEAAAAVPAAKA